MSDPILTITETYVNCEPGMSLQEEREAMQRISDHKADIIHFLTKAQECVQDNNDALAATHIRKAQLLMDSLIIYKLHRGI
jgi:hypothetical protein